MNFNDLIFSTEPNPIRDIQAKVFFPNGYGASVIRGEYTYGGPEGLYELAVLRGTPQQYSITYDTPITSDVEGYLTPDMVTELLQAIEALPIV